MAGRTRRGGLLAVAALAVAAACSGGDGNGAAEAEEQAPRPDVIVALGDSFSSGEGAPPYDARPEPCRRSADAWPRLLERRPEVASVELLACAGAETDELTGPWESRDLGPQIPERPRPEVTVVLLTIGGNDIGFGDIVATCVLLTCSPGPGSDTLDERLDALRTALVQDVHPALARAFPNARIVHVGYPHLAPPPEVEPRGCPWMSGDDQRISRGIVDALDEVIEEAAQQSGTARYADVADAFADHELCTEEPWVNAVGLGPGAAHPNPDGQRALAAAVADALDTDIGS